MTLQLRELQHCFQGIAPAIIATCSADGEPNVTYLSQVFYVDDRHVALSCQFFNKTRRNVGENPYASVTLIDPVTFDGYKLRLRYVRSETTGATFETMAARIQVIASHTGMAGVFRLIAADFYEVLSLTRSEGLLLPPDPVLDAIRPAPATGVLSEVHGLQQISDRIARAETLDGLLHGALAALADVFGFDHSMVLLPGGATGRLVVTASRGYADDDGVGGEIAVGHGLIGTVAQRRRMVRVAGMGSELRYGRAIRERAAATCLEYGGSPEVPLPGLQDAQAQLGLPMLICDRLIGVLAFESKDPLRFDEWDEAFLQIVANQIGLAVDRLQLRQTLAAAGGLPGSGAAAPSPAPSPVRPPRTFLYYENDDCVFYEGHYLVRNLPGRILWHLLQRHARDGQREFTNRELRLDGSLGLPAIKDNLESRLILLRRRLEEKCADVRMVPIARGRFELRVECEPVLRVAVNGEVGPKA